MRLETTVVATIKHVCAVAVIFLSATSAFAGELTINWTPATQCDDGKPFAPGDRSPEIWEWSEGTAPSTFGSTVLGVKVAPSVTATTLTLTDLPEGKTICVRGYTNVREGTCGNPIMKSPPSPVACKAIPIIDHGSPKPPTIVTISSASYNFKLQSTGAIRLVRSAEDVPVGIECGRLSGLSEVGFGLVGERVGICVDPSLL
jgi:hypothetical protein